MTMGGNQSNRVRWMNLSVRIWHNVYQLIYDVMESMTAQMEVTKTIVGSEVENLFVRSHQCISANLRCDGE